jgi:hypothetical protein
MSNSDIKESNKKNELDFLLNSPIIPKRIQEIIPSPLFLNKNRNLLKDTSILQDNNEKDTDDEISISYSDSDNEINSTDEDDSINEIEDDIQTEGKKLCILDLLKEISRENYN